VSPVGAMGGLRGGPSACHDYGHWLHVTSMTRAMTGDLDLPCPNQHCRKHKSDMLSPASNAMC
jgi:hypothetical protein